MRRETSSSNSAMQRRVLQRSSVSVGSIYHHFGGKAEVFDGLWQSFTVTCSRAARSGTATASGLGITDPVELFIAGAVGYLSMLSDPGTAKLSSIFRPGNGPPGFDARVRRLQEVWSRSNAMIFGLDNSIAGRLRAAVVTAIIAEGEYRYAAEQDASALEVVIEEVVSLLRRVLA